MRDQGRLRLEPALEHRNAARRCATAVDRRCAGWRSPTTSSASARSSWTASGARSGPAGNTRPLPMPRLPSTTTIDRSLISEGFWNPSSMTITLAPTASMAPATRSRATIVGASRASSSGSSPTSDARCRAGIDPHRSGVAAAIAAGEKKRPLRRTDQQPRHRKRGRRLARAAEGEIADAEHRHLGLAARPPERLRSDRAIAGGQRRKQRGGDARAAPPERRLTHRPTGARAEAAPDRDRAPASVRSSAPASVSMALSAASATAWRAGASLSQAPTRTASLPASATCSAAPAASSAE